VVAASGVLVLAASGCGGDTVEGGGDASCALVVRYQGVVYDGRTVQVAPREGRRLGPGVLPACDDGDGDSADEEIELAEIESVSSGVALAWVGEPGIVFVRHGAEFPPEVEQLLRAPSCEARDAPIELAGDWLGILGADGHTEVDLEPPYDVDLFVQQASEARYERIYLTVRVPPALGKPITRDDVESSLWEGGSIALRVRCADDGGYVAEGVEASPPS